MKRRWNLWLPGGFLASFIALVSYFMVFARWPVTRDVPWASALMFAGALAMTAFGLHLAYRRPGAYRGKVHGPIFALLTLALTGLFVWYVGWFSSSLPASAAAPSVNSPAPDFTLPDAEGRPVSLSGVLSGQQSGQPKWALLVFYRGYW